jgi:hypothetical protein
MRRNPCFFGFILLAFLSVSCYSAHAAESANIPVGTILPELKMEGPTSDADQEYLGLTGSKPFTLSQISGKFIIMDFFNAL